MNTIAKYFKQQNSISKSRCFLHRSQKPNTIFLQPIYVDLACTYAYYFSLGAWGIFFGMKHKFKNLHSTCYNENLIMIFTYLFSFLTLFLGLSIGYSYILPSYLLLPWYNFGYYKVIWPLSYRTGIEHTKYICSRIVVKCKSKNNDSNDW